MYTGDILYKAFQMLFQLEETEFFISSLGPAQVAPGRRGSVTSLPSTLWVPWPPSCSSHILLAPSDPRTSGVAAGCTPVSTRPFLTHLPAVTPLLCLCVYKGRNTPQLLLGP